MKRFVFALIVLVTFGVVAAQDVATTTGTGVDEFETNSSGGNTASVSQAVNVVVPPRVGLHLDVSQLDFDLDLINTDQMLCVYGVSEDLGPEGWDGSTLPRGLAYDLTTEFGTGVDIVAYGGDRQVEFVTQYPPARFDDETGELIQGSKAGFVCFRTFIVQKFSNYAAGFDISVDRDGGDFDMYVQDNSECSWNDYLNTFKGGDADGLDQDPGNGVTGFYKVDDGATVGGLLPDVYSSATTGDLSQQCGGNDKGGWHDDQMIVAVAFDGHQASGTDTATLTYTITGTVAAPE